MTAVARKDIPALDLLCDSPIISPTSPPGSSLLNTLPASALAERIFNDPEAWKVHSDEDEPRVEFPLDETEVLEQLSWLEKELMSFSMLATPTAIKEPRNEQALVGDENITNFPSPASPRANGPAIGHQELAISVNEQQDKHRITPKPGQIAVFPAYVHDPPGGLDAPGHAFAKNVLGLEDGNLIQPISLAHLLNPEAVPPDCFSAEGNAEFANTVEGITDHERLTHAISPPTSEASTSSTSSSGYNCLRNKSYPPPPFDLLNVPDISSFGHPVPPASAATSIVSPFKVNSGSTTLSFLEWYGISPESPLAKAAAAGNDRVSSGGAAPPSATPDYHLPTQSSPLVGNAVASDTEGDQNSDVYDTPNMVSIRVVNGQGGLSGQVWSQSYDAIKPGDNKPDPSPSTKQSESARKHSLPETSRRSGAMYESPIKIRPNTPILTRGSPKPPPAIPIPDVPSDDPPPVPPKDISHGLPGVTKHRVRKVNSKGKAPIRRLPSIPKRVKSATQKTELESSNASSSSVTHTPPPAPPHTSAHSSYRSSNDSGSSMRAPGTAPRAAYTRFGPTSTTTTPSPSPSLTTSRTPSGPVGPRRRDATTTPITSARWTRSHASSSSVSGITLTTGIHAYSPMSAEPVTISRSISVPQGIPRHGHSRSQ